MLVGDAGFFLLVFALPVLGFIGFFVILVTIIFRVLAFVARNIAGTEARERGMRGGVAPGAGVCPNTLCRHVNRPSARYCARCGRPLGRWRDLDAYG